MLVKVVEQKGRETTYECRHIIKTPLEDENGESIGVLVELMPEGRQFHLPRDCEVIYQMNDEGRTTDTHRWGDPAAVEWPFENKGQVIL